MPTVTIINDTSVPLHVSLSQVSPLHYVNSVPSGGQACIRAGRVWFTIQARIDRGDNAYDKFQVFAPIAVVTIGALSLGAGAVYVVGGTAGAALATLTARIGASVAAATPTAKRLYKLAQRGHSVARVGKVIGISSSATGTEKGKGKGAVLEEQTKKALTSLLHDSVLNSPGWHINRDRTFRITGGPQASIVDGILVIETDTAIPFQLIDETPAPTPKAETKKKWRIFS